MDKEKILEVLGNIIDINKEQLLKTSVDTKLTDLGLTSIQFIQFIVAIEEEFEIEILDSDLIMTNFETVEMLFSTLEKYFTPKSTLKKVLICDCDNVLWHGISGEEEIYIDATILKFQETLIELYNRGILICLCSKNEPENIETVFNSLEMPLKKNHILISKINLTDKATNIKEIALELNLSADSFVFVDDSKYELDLVSSIIPDITTVLADYSNCNFIEKIKGFFDGSSTDINRTQQYRNQKEREKEKQRYASAEEFNASLKTEVKCETASSDQAARISELSQRTNQFNLSDVRYTEEKINYFIRDEGYCVYVLSASDKYGDRGLVGAAVVRKTENPVIIGFFLSCRVFGRGFEEHFLNKIKSNFAVSMYGIYKRTDKNKRFEDFYPKNGVEVYE